VTIAALGVAPAGPRPRCPPPQRRRDNASAYRAARRSCAAA